MRLGGPVMESYSNPEEWVQALRRWDYRAALCPVDASASAEEIQKYAAAAQLADIMIAEVGAWSNPLSPDADERRRALTKCKQQLGLAEAIGAVCCVNISGSRGEPWDGPHPDNYADETFDMVVETVRDIIDTVQPQRTYFTLEPMPWMLPDSPDSYLQLLTAVDRKQFAVHMDIVNWISSPKRHLRNAAFIKECFAKLGPYIKSCHAKDSRLHGTMTAHLEEVAPGLGQLDYAAFLQAVDQLHPDTPVILEHLDTAAEYKAAGDHIRQVAQACRVPL